MVSFISEASGTRRIIRTLRSPRLRTASLPVMSSPRLTSASGTESSRFIPSALKAFSALTKVPRLRIYSRNSSSRESSPSSLPASAFADGAYELTMR